MTESLKDKLQKSIQSRVREYVDLSSLTRWKIGGRARYYVEPSTMEEVICIVRAMAGRSEPFFIMGGSSNILFDSRGFNGLVLRLTNELSKWRKERNELIAEAGLWVPMMCRIACKTGLSGIEHCAGIPGTLGGLIVMNGGSQKKGIGSSIRSVTCIDRNGYIRELSREECNFSYRDSIFQSSGYTILKARLTLASRNPAHIRHEMLEILRLRRGKFPRKLPNCGSTFLSNPSMYAAVGPPGKIIEEAGLKGLIKGGAQISPQHANFINNIDQASSDDILWLIREIRETVKQRTAYDLHSEAKYISPNGDIIPAHVAADLLRI